MSEVAYLTRHDRAAEEVNGWRGRCLNLYSRAEVAVAAALQLAADKDSVLTVRHLAGQRLADLVKFAEANPNCTEKQKNATLRALRAWEDFESKRVYYAHGVGTVLLDRDSSWHVQFDFTRYGKSNSGPQRWNCSKKEAEEFEAALNVGFKNLSAQLGQLRQRLAT